MPGVVSIWYGPPGGPPAYARADRETHYAASMMKLAVLAGLYREHEAGRVTLDEKLPVHNEFRSVAPGAGTFGCRRSYDSDEAVWERLGTTASLRWLARRMIVRSSNLATNLILERIGYDAATAAWRASGAEQSIVARPIEDRAAADQGIANLVTAADVAALLGAIAQDAITQGATSQGAQTRGTVANRDSCRDMLDILLAQELRDDLAAGLPPGTKVAHKNGWVMGVRHAGGVVFPDDAEPFVLAVCLSTPRAVNRSTDKACRLVARIAAAAWHDREQRPLTHP